MRIGMILDNQFPPDSRVENEALSLIKAGYEVFLFCVHYGEQAETENSNGINVRRYEINKITYKLSALAYTLPFYHWIMKQKILDFALHQHIQAIHIHDMTIAVAALKVAEELQIPSILDLHENRPAIMKHYGHVNTWKGKLLINPKKWEKEQKQIIGKADRLILVTEEAKRVALEYNNKPAKHIFVVPNTIHPDIYGKYALEDVIINKYRDTFNILYLGDTGLRRGTDTAILSIKLLISKIKNIKLILVGKNSQDYLLKEQVKRLGIESFVEFEGWRDVSLFPSFVEASHICISPLKRNLHHDTTFANKIFQYMAMGKPVIVSDCPPQAKVIEEEQCGLVHKAEDEGDLADKIYALYRDKKKAKEMGDKGRKAVERKWNWKKTSYELIKIYDTLFN